MCLIQLEMLKALFLSGYAVSANLLAVEAPEAEIRTTPQKLECGMPTKAPLYMCLTRGVQSVLGLSIPDIAPCAIKPPTTLQKWNGMSTKVCCEVQGEATGENSKRFSGDRATSLKELSLGVHSSAYGIKDSPQTPIPQIKVQRPFVSVAGSGPFLVCKYS